MAPLVNCPALEDMDIGDTPIISSIKPLAKVETLKTLRLGSRLKIIDLSALAESRFVDVTATSKGKGFQGGMKRHNFRGQQASHGVERKHRSGGSIGGHASNLGTGPKIKKGKRMAGHMGDERVTVRSLDVIKTDIEQNLLVVKGPIPGPNGAFVYIKPAARLYKSKAHIQAGT